MNDHKKTSVIFIVFFLVCMLTISREHAWGECTATGCHSGINDIVPMTLGMMQLIKQTGQRHGDPDGCVICHGGNPDTVKKKKAHRSIPWTLKKAAGPKTFYPDPGSVWIAQNTCGVCHPGYVYRVKRSLMNTEAGKIQANLHAWGIESVKNHKVPWGNYDIKDTNGPIPMDASPQYESYMAEMISHYPDQYPDHLSRLPLPEIRQIEKNPKLAGYTYQRQKCQRCHVGVRGHEVSGDFRGLGCSACHMPYSRDGFYKGKDLSIPKNEPGHILRHQIIGNRKTGGIPTETCNACHNGGKQIGVSYLGLMASPYKAPFDQNGNHQATRHGKTYLPLSGDLHHQTGNSRMKNPEGGLLCQDCHTSMDIHGDGNIHGTTLAQVEIECTDCHGTPDKLPWELPLGHKDEFGIPVSLINPRGVADQTRLSDQQFGFKHDRQNGFLITARGNPFNNVVRSDTGVTVYSAAGNNFKVPLLKQINKKSDWKNSAAKTAMSSVATHLNRMECYTCHSAWAPQSYGRHIKVDYQKSNPGETDWTASGNAQLKNGQTAESKRGARGIISPATIDEYPAFLRWEDPVLGINGEGNISPLMPGCQVIYTVVGQDGKHLAQSRIENEETDAGVDGQDPVLLSIDMAPANPHTNQRKARSCENCHTNQKTAGLGMGNTASYFQGIDLSQVVAENGRQIATVGTHWPLSRALNKIELDGFLRIGTCMGCHRNMDNKVLWEKVSTKGSLDSSRHIELMTQALKNMK